MQVNFAYLTSVFQHQDPYGGCAILHTFLHGECNSVTMSQSANTSAVIKNTAACALPESAQEK